MDENKLFTQLLFSRDHLRNKPWTGIGSAIFVYLDGGFYLLTAAHVLLDNQGYACLLNINGKPIDLAGYKAEKNEEMDICAIRLEEQDYNEISKNTFFITEDMLRSEEALESKIILMGYPRSRNRSKLRDQRFQPTVWQHISIDALEKHKPKIEEYREYHFAAAYDPKNTENKNGVKERTPDKLNGISGGIALEFFMNADGDLRYCPLGMIQGMNSKSKIIYGATLRYLFLWLKHNSMNFQH